MKKTARFDGTSQLLAPQHFASVIGNLMNNPGLMESHPEFRTHQVEMERTMRSAQRSAMVMRTKSYEIQVVVHVLRVR